LPIHVNEKKISRRALRSATTRGRSLNPSTQCFNPILAIDEQPYPPPELDAPRFQLSRAQDQIEDLIVGGLKSIFIGQRNESCSMTVSEREAVVLPVFKPPLSFEYSLLNIEVALLYITIPIPQFPHVTQARVY
jgi:hypothetical protein